jgi:hypothetical protein
MLPSYIPRTDSFGNTYFGGFQVDNAVEVGYGVGTLITPTEAQLQTFFTAAFGAANWVKGGSVYYFRFANEFEPLTGPISSSANYRFSWDTTAGGGTIYLNTALTGTPVNMSTSPNLLLANITSSTYSTYAVANAYGMWLLAASEDAANPGQLSSSTEMNVFYMGWLKDGVFPTPDRIRNCVIGGNLNNGSNSIRCSRAPGTTLSGLVSLNNVITCESATPGANITDAVAIDTNTSNLALGKLHNCLVTPNALIRGRLYRIPSSADPDGNTEQNIWLCVRPSAFAFNGTSSAVDTQSILVRVWSNQIT